MGTLESGRRICARWLTARPGKKKKKNCRRKKSLSSLSRRVGARQTRGFLTVRRTREKGKKPSLGFPPRDIGPTQQKKRLTQERRKEREGGWRGKADQRARFEEKGVKPVGKGKKAGQDWRELREPSSGEKLSTAEKKGGGGGNHLSQMKKRPSHEEKEAHKTNRG